MIDLREPLQDSIEFDGKRYRLDTDFRTWIRFDHDLQHHGMANSCVFIDKPPSAEILGKLMEFYQNPNVTPRGSSSTDKAVDMVWDGDYIVASFMQAYNVDLTRIDYMHWHVFKALLYGLPENTIMAQIMAYRTYRKSNKKYEEAMNEQKRKWSLPTLDRLEERKNLLEWAERMGL